MAWKVGGKEGLPHNVAEDERLGCTSPPARKGAPPQGAAGKEHARTRDRALSLPAPKASRGLRAPRAASGRAAGVDSGAVACGGKEAARRWRRRRHGLVWAVAAAATPVGTHLERAYRSSTAWPPFSHSPLLLTQDTPY
eukprot:362471-Chlamydomonas_euryale.AAC.4